MAAAPIAAPIASATSKGRRRAIHARGGSAAAAGPVWDDEWLEAFSIANARSLRRLEPKLWRLLEASPDDPQERRRDAGSGCLEISGLSRQDRAHRVRGGFLSERALAADHLVEQAAEREQVRTVVDRPAPHLLWSHVPDRPEHCAGFGQGSRRHRLRIAPGSVHGPGEGRPVIIARSPDATARDRRSTRRPMLPVSGSTPAPGLPKTEEHKG